MRFSRRSTWIQLLTAGVLLAPADARAQSVLERTPNLAGGWVGTAGTAHFNFLHRFEHTDPPTRKVVNFPTFLLGYTAGSRLLLAVSYATNSDLVPAFPNEWEPFARMSLPALGPVAFGLTGAWNSAAESLDGEAAWRLRTGPLALLGTARAFSSGYGEDARFAVGGGAVLALGDNVSLAGDAVTLLDRESGEEVAWGAAVQALIPYTPHTLSLQVTNTNTATLQGSSRGSDATRFGFEFTVPITLSRYFGGGGGEATATGVDTVVVAIRDFEFAPARLTISTGTTVVWVNEGEVVHTATADDGSWDSGDILPGSRWSRTFTRSGQAAYHCIPHPFMQGTIVVSGADR